MLSQNIDDDGDDADSEDNCIVDKEQREAYLAERKAKLADYSRAYYNRPEVVEKRKAKKDAIDPQELAARAEKKRIADREYYYRPDVVAKRQLTAKAKKDEGAKVVTSYPGRRSPRHRQIVSVFLTTLGFV